MDFKEFYKVKESIVFLNEDGENSIWDHKAGWKVKLNDTMQNIISLFSIPINKKLAIKKIVDNHNLQENKASEIIDYLIAEGIIEPYYPKSEILDNNSGIFNTPVISIKDCLSGDWCDVAFVGMPYDLNVTYKPGCRFAPSYLRKVSRAVFNYNSKTLDGYYDLNDKKQKLQNFRLADCGDINANAFTKNGHHFDALKEIIYKISSKNIFPVTLGGDHSIAYPCIEAISKDRKVKILQFDAHSDFGNIDMTDWRTSLHHGNFIDKVIELENVVEVIQIGVRQLSSKNYQNKKVKIYPNRTILNQLESFIKNLETDISYYITLDVDVFDPLVMKATGTPLPGGFDYKELVLIIEQILRKVNVIGLDVVELLPGKSEVEGVIISDIILKIITMAMERR